MAINRRAFLKSIAVGLVGAALDTRIDQILQETTNLTDGDFITYITASMNLWVSNPAQSAVITDIGVPSIQGIKNLTETNKSHNRLAKSRMRRNNKNKTASHSRKRNWA